MADIVTAERTISKRGLSGMDRDRLLAAKQMGFSDAQIARLTSSLEEVVRGVRTVLGIRPVVKTVDTCASEFAAHTSYHYLTYEEGGTTEHVPATRPRVIILSAGPNRIGQGVEFDYCCVHHRKQGLRVAEDPLEPLASLSITPHQILGCARGRTSPTCGNAQRPARICLSCIYQVCYTKNRGTHLRRFCCKVGWAVVPAYGETPSCTGVSRMARREGGKDEPGARTTSVALA